jgi:hypothetical protein
LAIPSLAFQHRLALSLTDGVDDRQHQPAVHSVLRAQLANTGSESSLLIS